MPLVGLQCVIVVFPGHTQIHFENNHKMPQSQTIDQKCKRIFEITFDTVLNIEEGCFQVVYSNKSCNSK